jgi:hypothetical protein
MHRQPSDLTDSHVFEDAYHAVYERADTHGAPEDSFDAIAQLWNSYLQSAGYAVELDAAEVCKLFILMKLARSAAGVYDADNPVDVAGYAENWARLLDDDADDVHAWEPLNK